MDYKSVAWNPQNSTWRLRSAQDVTRMYAETLCQRISRRIIRDCQSLKDCLLSGDDTVLGNTWDEVCVQIQFQESVYWDAYEDTMHTFVMGYLEELSDYEQFAIWLQTDEGREWQWDIDQSPEDVAGKEPDFLLSDLAYYVLRAYVYLAAGRWSNRRIEEYLERH
jgi:hypothetical protein